MDFIPIPIHVASSLMDTDMNFPLLELHYKVWRVVKEAICIVLYHTPMNSSTDITTPDVHPMEAIARTFTMAYLIKYRRS